ncbi:MAG TPA: HAMP domain-containing histidine kinase [Deltaproteobacteria bacterium]|nr:HAMP domain-containing histidine kinase [Deltaproteobacteria bacterium]
MRYQENDTFYLSAFVAVAVFATIIFAFSSIWHVEKNLKNLAIKQGAFTSETLLKNFVSAFADRKFFEKLIYMRIIKTARLLKRLIQEGKNSRQLKLVIDKNIIDQAVYISKTGKYYVIVNNGLMNQLSLKYPMLFFMYQNHLNNALSNLKKGEYKIVGEPRFSKTAIAPINYIEHFPDGGYLLITLNSKKLALLNFRNALDLIFDKLKSDKRINNILFFNVNGSLIKRLRKKSFPDEEIGAPYSLLKIGDIYHLISRNIVRLNGKIVGYLSIDLKEIELSRVIKLEKLYTAIISIMLIFAATIIITVIYALRKKSMEEIVGLKKDIEKMKRSEALNTLAASLAHEIRNPLNAISLMVQAASKRKEVTSSGAILIKEEINRLNKLVTDFLSFSKIQKIEKRIISLLKFLNDTVDIFRETAEKKEVKIIVDSTENEIAIDVNMTRQAIENLILNAIDASKPKSTIKLSGKIVSKELIISITDKGIGMDEDTLSHALDPYFTTKQNGTGLGLPTVSKIVYIMGGTIHIDSKIGKGTTAVIRIPQ